MARTSYWAEQSDKAIAPVVAAYKGKDERELRHLISEAYPFGMRENHPYKAWLKRVSAHVDQWATLTPGVQRIEEPPPVLCGLFDDPSLWGGGKAVICL